MGSNQASGEAGSRVVPFRRRASKTRAPVHALQPADALARYARGSETDDYRHRMLVNAAAFLFVLGLIGAGLWLADSMAELQRDQDCVLAGHRNCLQIDVRPNHPA